MNRNSILSLTLLGMIMVTSSSCIGQQRKRAAAKRTASIVLIDTTRQGIYGDTSYVMTVTKKIRGLKIEQRQEYFGADKQHYYKQWYYDSKRQARFIFGNDGLCDSGIDSVHFYSFRGPDGNSVLDIDSAFSGGKIEKVTLGAGNFPLCQLQISFKDGEIYQKEVDDPNGYIYVQRGDDFYDMDGTVIAEYSQCRGPRQFPTLD
jgi:hypothetical protein